MKYAFTAVLFLILISASALAQDYYADVVFDIAADGGVTISGTTNHPLLQPTITQSLTSKTKDTWVFSFTAPDEFSEAVYEIRLPAESALETVRVPDGYRIITKDGRVTVIGTVEKAPLNISLTYTFLPQAAPVPDLIPILAVCALALFGAGVYALKLKKPIAGTAVPRYNKAALTDRQLVITEYLEKYGHATQAELQKITALPKASLSRNLTGLERKNIITKERKGMTMLITLKRE